MLFPIVFEVKASLPKATLSSPVVFELKALCPIAVLLYPVVFEVKVFGPKAILFEILPAPKPKFNPLIEPVTPKDPVIWAEPVNGNGGVWGAYEADRAYEALTAKSAYELEVS